MALQMVKSDLIRTLFCEIYKRLPIKGEKRKILTDLRVKF